MTGFLASEVSRVLHTFGWHLPEVFLGGFAEALVEGIEGDGQRFHQGVLFCLIYPLVMSK